MARAFANAKLFTNWTDIRQKKQLDQRFIIKVRKHGVSAKPNKYSTIKNSFKSQIPSIIFHEGVPSDLAEPSFW